MARAPNTNTNTKSSSSSFRSPSCNSDFITKRSEEIGFSLMNSNSGNHYLISGDSHHNDTTTPLPVISASPFPHWNMNEITQCYSKDPTGVNSMTGSSNFKSAQDSQMDHQGEEHKHLPCGPDSVFPYQYARPDNVAFPNDVMNAAFHLNSFETPHSGAKCVTPSDSLAGRSLMVNLTGPVMSDNISQPQPQPQPESGMHRPDSGFPCSQCYIRRAYQYCRPDNLMVPNDVMNAAFNLNSFQNPYSDAKCETPSDSLTRRPQMVYSTGQAMCGNIRQSQPPPEGYIGRLYQYARRDNLMIPNDLKSAAFNLNAFEKPHSGAKCVTPSVSLAGKPQLVNATGPLASGNITGQSLVNMNFGVPMFNANQGGAEPLLTPGKIDERFTTVGSKRNIESRSNTNIPRINVTGNSERTILPPINTYHNQVGSRSVLNQCLDMNGAFSGFQNYSEVISDLAHTGNHEVLLNSRPGLHLRPSYAFQRPAAADQNYHLRQVNRGLGLVGADVGRRIGFERCTALSSMPFAGSQTLPYDNGQSRVNGQLVPSSVGIVTDQSSSGNFSSQFLAVPPLAVAPGSTRGQGLSSNNGQSQVVGSIQQSNSPIGPYSTNDLGIQTGKGNTASQVSRPSISSSLKRSASQPTSSTVQGQRRKTVPTHPFIQPSTPTQTRLAPPVLNTPQAIPPLIRAAQSLTPQPTYSSIPPIFPTTRVQSALSALNISQTVHPLVQTSPFVPPHDNRISSLHPSSHTPPLPNQQLLVQSLAQQHLRTQIISSTSNISPVHIKYTDQTPEPIGHKCFLCKRDISYTPEGPIFQPAAPPAAAVLSCGHTFHEQCLERITPDDHSNDPPCIPCALGD